MASWMPCTNLSSSSNKSRTSRSTLSCAVAISRWVPPPLCSLPLPFFFARYADTGAAVGAQAVRNMTDMNALACPVKFRAINTFYKYYSGEKVAPVTTIFIGGNHEASNHLTELCVAVVVPTV